LETVKVFRWEFGWKVLSGRVTLADATLAEVRVPRPKGRRGKNRKES